MFGLVLIFDGGLITLFECFLVSIYDLFSAYSRILLNFTAVYFINW